MIYEIINPSDPYTIEAKSLDVAFVALVFLGSGQYALEPLEEGGEGIPLFILGGVEGWCQEHLRESFKSAVDRVMDDAAKRAELADCFESCLIGKAADREAYQSGLGLIDDPAKREQWKLQWHERRRSSINDIGGRAYRMAGLLRAGAKNPLIPAPQQVFS